MLVSDYDERVIREAGKACQLARLHDCTIEIHIRRRLIGPKLDVVITPLSGKVTIDSDVTDILQPQEGR